MSSDSSLPISRRAFLALTGTAASVLTLGRSLAAGEEDEGMAAPERATVSPGKLEKTKAEWRALLPADRYAVLFDEGTERPGSSPLNAEKRPGTFVCAACFLPLFDSKAKYESGTGWPSFFDPIPGRVDTRRDFKLILLRTEYHCARCGGHQGHLFSDGPQPTGKRYCNNGVALEFVPEGDALPALRT